MDFIEYCIENLLEQVLNKDIRKKEEEKSSV